MKHLAAYHDIETDFLLCLDCVSPEIAALYKWTPVHEGESPLDTIECAACHRTIFGLDLPSPEHEGLWEEKRDRQLTEDFSES